MQSLEAQLLDELALLGKDPQRIVSSAPQGSGNAVFNLQAEIVDPDDSGGNAPTGVQLSWTARVIGDYDQNGEVGIADITPLGQFFKGSVSYDAAELHDGISYWPQGDPFAAGSSNWRSAAVDGDGNGEINVADITPIAIHFGERMDGFNIFIRETGETEYSILPNLLDPFRDVSVGLQPAGNNPANYSVQIPWPSSGMAEIAVAGYDTSTGGGAALSNSVTVSGDPGPPAGTCTADLTVDVQSGQAPLNMSFGLGSSSTGAAGAFRYVLSTGEQGVRFSFTDSAEFPLDYTYISAGNFTAQLAVACLQDGSVAFSDTIQINVTDPALPGLTVKGFVWQYEENPELGNPDEPAKNGLDGMEVELYILGTASPLATTHSNASGEYVFPDLQLDASVELLNVKVSQAQKDALLPLSWLPGEHILLLEDGQETLIAPDMNLLATPIGG